MMFQFSTATMESLRTLKGVITSTEEEQGEHCDVDDVVACPKNGSGSSSSALVQKSHQHQHQQRGAIVVVDSGDDENCSVGTASTEESSVSFDTSLSSLESCDDDDCSSSGGGIRSPPTATKKSVRFAPAEATVYHANAAWRKEDVRDAAWYTGQEYRRMKQHTQALAREVSKSEERNRAPYSYQRVLVRVHDLCRDRGLVHEPTSVYWSSSSHNNDDSNDDDDSTDHVLSRDDRRHLKRWADYAPTRLGLEKWAVRPIARERAVRRAEMFETVLGLQETFRGGTGSGGDPELLALASRRVSRPSRLFARCMAQANAPTDQQETAAAAVQQLQRERLQQEQQEQQQPQQQEPQPQEQEL